MKAMQLMAVALVAACVAGGCATSGMLAKCTALDPNGHQPVPVVAPPSQLGQPPANAVVLFDGVDASAWVNANNGGAFPWKVEDGCMEVVHEEEYVAIRTAREFGDCHLHVEWATPAMVTGDGQGRGNSGVYLMGRYEVQVLDSYRNETYPDGQAAAIYGQYPPAFNVSRGPGQWQTYDIVFRRPRFDADGNLQERARMTVLHNGVAVHDNVELLGFTWSREQPCYEPHGDRGPVLLQDHGNPVRYRNIWLVELPDEQPPVVDGPRGKR